jgi:hypothetical protein
VKIKTRWKKGLGYSKSSEAPDLDKAVLDLVDAVDGEYEEAPVKVRIIFADGDFLQYKVKA